MRDSSLPRFAARIGLVASDVAFPLVIALVLTLGFASPAYAYVDPSVMTYTIQALAGVAVALSAVLGVVWRRMRRHLLHILRIDENEGKQVEGAVHALDPLAFDYRDRLDRAESEARRMKAKQASNKPETLCWRARFLFSLVASLMLVYTFAVVAPLEIVASSVNSLLFTVTDVWVPFAVVGLAGTVVLALALSLLRGRAFNVCFAVVAAVGVAGFVQQAACTALTLPVDPWRQTVAEQSEYSWQRLNEIGLTCPQPEGSFYCFPSIVSTGLTSEQFALKLAEQAGVAVLPGTLFGQHGAGHVRLSVCTDRQTLDWALDQIEKWIKADG